MLTLSEIYQNYSIVIIVIGVVLVQKVKARFYRMGYVFISLVYLVTTIQHEALHYLVAKLTFARPSGFNMIPKKLPNGQILLGTVSVSNLTWYNATPVAIAPLFLLFFAYWVQENFFFFYEFNALNFFLSIALMTLLVESSLPSITDWKVAFSKPFGFLFYLFLLLFYAQTYL